MAGNKGMIAVCLRSRQQERSRNGPLDLVETHNNQQLQRQQQAVPLWSPLPIITFQIAKNGFLVTRVTNESAKFAKKTKVIRGVGCRGVGCRGVVGYRALSLSLSLGLPPTRAEGPLNEILNRIQFVFDSEFYLAALLPLCRAAQERERESERTSLPHH